MTTAQTEKPMTVYDCIVAVSREIAQQGISKTRSNAQQGYKFRGIDDVLNALSPLLAKYRLVILPRILSRSVVERATQKGGVLFYVTVEAEFDFVSAADSSTHTVKTYGEAMDSADKATNKAMSAAYKYAAFQTFCIPTEGDNDADAVTHEPLQRSQAPTPMAVASPRPAVVIPSVPNGRDIGHSHSSDAGADLPEGARRIVRVGPGRASAAGEITFDNGESFLTWKSKLVALAEQWCQDGTLCVPELKRSGAGNVRLESLAPFALMSKADRAATTWTPEQLAEQGL